MKSSHTTDSAQQILLVLFNLHGYYMVKCPPSLQRLWLLAYYNPSLLSHIPSNHGFQNEVTFIPSFLVENHISTRSSTLANMVRTSYPLPGGIGSFAEFWPLERFKTQRFHHGFKCFLFSPLFGEGAPFQPIFLRLHQTTYLKVTNVSMFIQLAVVFVNDRKLRGFLTSVALHIHRFFHFRYSGSHNRCKWNHSDTSLDLWLLTLTWGPIIMAYITASIELKLPFYQIYQRIRTQHQLQVDAANQNSNVDCVLDSNRWHRCFPLSKELLCFIPRN